MQAEHSTFNIKHLTFLFPMDYKSLLTKVEKTLAQIENVEATPHDRADRRDDRDQFRQEPESPAAGF
jgi:hypothetical protein